MRDHEGKAIAELLSERGLKPAALAEACDVTWPAVKKYLQAAKLQSKAWDTCSRGLEKLGIDPALIRPRRLMLVAHAPAIDLKPLVVGFDRSQMEKLKQILESDEGARLRLIDFIDGYLSSSKK